MRTMIQAAPLPGPIARGELPADTFSNRPTDGDEG